MRYRLSSHSFHFTERTHGKHWVLHPDNPQTRYLSGAVDALRQGGVVVLPTDSGYALATAIDNKKGYERICQIRHLDKQHYFTLLCRNLSDISLYAKVDNAQYRFLKSLTPGAYTFILQSSAELPKRIAQGSRKTIGIRVPDHIVVRDLLELYGAPLLSTTLALEEFDVTMSDEEEIFEQIGHAIEVFLSTERVIFEPTTVLDLSDGAPKLVRAGQGNVPAFL